MSIQKFQLPPEVFKLDTYLDFLADPKKYAKLHKELTGIVDDINVRIVSLDIGKNAVRAFARAEKAEVDAHTLLETVKKAKREWEKQEASDKEHLARTRQLLLSDTKTLADAQKRHEENAAGYQVTLSNRHEELNKKEAAARNLSNEAFALKSEYESKLKRLSEKLKSEV